jgi:lipopolysaccharide transport system permease protein
LNHKKNSTWDLIITPHRGLFEFRFQEIWNYRDLLSIYIHRDIVTQYKQTILGPIWIIIPPLLTTFVFTVIFGQIAQISTDGIPSVLFYMAGIINWNYFSNALISTSNSLAGNAGIFGKVYFPRVLVPLSTLISSLLRYAIQFILFLGIAVYFYLNGIAQFSLKIDLLWMLPFLILIMAILGLGFGLIFSALTAKYRDIRFLISFGVRLAMYTSTVIFPLSAVPEAYKHFILFNPMSPIIETFRSIFFNSGAISYSSLGFSVAVALLVLFSGMIIFNKVEQNFVDNA